MQVGLKPEGAQSAQLPECNCCIQKMEEILFLPELKSASGLTYQYPTWFTVMILGILYGVGCFFLVLPFLPNTPPVRPPRKRIKPQVETRRSSRSSDKGDTLKAFRSFLQELYGTQNLRLRLRQNHLGNPPDTGSFGQQKAQALSGSWRNRGTAEVHVYADAPDSSAAHPFRTPGSQTSTVPRVLMCLSTSHVLPTLSQSPDWAHSREPDSLSPTPLALPSPNALPLDSLTYLQPPSTLCDSPAPHPTGTHSQNDLLARPRQSPSPHNRCSTPAMAAITSQDPTGRPTSSPPQCWAAAKNLQLPSLEYFGSLKEHSTWHPQEDTFREGPTMRQGEVGRPTLLNPNVHKLLEIEITKAEKWNIWEEKGKGVSEYHLQALNMLKALDGEQITAPPQPFWNASIKAEQIPSPQKHFPQKFSAFFLGLPFLHSESLAAARRVSGSTLEFPTVLFNEIPNALPAQMQAKEYPLLLQGHTSPYTEGRFQPLSPTACQAQAPPAATVLTPPRPQPCGPLAVRFPQTHKSPCDESCLTVHNKSQSRVPNSLQQMECHFLKKQQESESSLAFMIPRPQEAFCLRRPTHPQDNQKVQTPKTDPKLPGCLNQSELHRQENFPQLQGPLGNGALESLTLKQPQEKWPGMCLDMKQAECSCSTPGDKQGKNVMKTVSPGRCTHPGPSLACCRAGVQLRNNSVNGQGNYLRKISKCNLSIRGSGNYCPKEAPGADPKELRCDLRIHTGINAGTYALRCPNKILLENSLNVHMCRKVEQIRKDQIPAIVCRSCLATTHALSISLTHPRVVNVASWGELGDLLNTTQSLSFLSPGTQQVLDSHIVRLQMRQRWCMPLKVPEPTNLCRTRKDNAMSFPQSTFLGTPKSSTNPVTEAVKVLAEPCQADWGERVTTKKSSPTLESSFADCSLTEEPVQGTPAYPPLDNDSGCSLALRQPFPAFMPSILGRTFQNESVQRESLEQTSSPVLTSKGSRKEGASCAPGGPRLEVNSECPSSRAKETGLVVVKKSSSIELDDRDTFKTSVLAKSQTNDVDRGCFEALGCSKSFLLPGKCAPVPEKPSLTARVCSEIKLQVEVEAEGGSPCCPADELLQDCTTDVLTATNVLPSQVVHCCPQRLFTGDKPICQGPSGFVVARARYMGQQKLKSPNIQERLTRRRKDAVPTDKREAHKWPKPEEHGKGLAGRGISQVCGLSQPVQDKILAECLEIKSPLLPPEKGQLPAEGHCKKWRKHFIQWICSSKKSIGHSDPLQKGNPVLTCVHSLGPLQRQPVSPNKATEAQVLMTDVGQVLEGTPGCHQEYLASTLCPQKEAQASVNGCSSSCRAPFYVEHRRVACVRPCLHQAIPDYQSLPTTSTCIRDVFTNFCPFRGFNVKSHTQALPPRVFVCPVSFQQHRRRRWAYSSYPYHCPRHCLREYVLSGKLEDASSALISRKISMPATLDCSAQANGFSQP